MISGAICAFIRSLNPRPPQPMKALTRTGMSGQKPLATMTLYLPACAYEYRVISLCGILANKYLRWLVQSSNDFWLG